MDSDQRSPLDALVALLDIEQIEDDIFRGHSPEDRQGRVFGGQVAAQALVAATRTVADVSKPAHSLHCYFLRPGDPSRPIVFEVDRIRDGRSYVTRRVVGIQAGKAIFNLQASFHVHEDGYEHQIPAPADVPGPDEAEDFYRWAGWPDAAGDELQSQPIEVRVAPVTSPFRRMVWIRAAGTLPDDPALHRHIAAYASDMTLLSITMQPHGFPKQQSGFMASVDHALWFHDHFRVDEWLLWDQETPFGGGGRAFGQGRVFTADGRLVASVVQEGAIRPPRPAGT